MEPLVVVVMGLVGVTTILLLGRARSNERLRLWRIAAEACNLTGVQESWGLGLSAMTGRAGDLWVRLAYYRRGKSESGTAVYVENTAHRLDWLTLRRETMGTAFEKTVLRVKEMVLGDEAFDADFFVTGAPALVRAVMDGQTRRTLRWLLSDVSFEVKDGQLRAELREGAFRRSPMDDLPRLLPRLLEAVQRLGRPEDVPTRLAEIAHGDPLPDVRREALLVLAREYPTGPETHEALRTGCSDPDPEIRLRAAMALGAVEGHQALLDLATGGPDAHAARAVTVLDRHLSRESCASILEQAMRTRRLETARACLATLARIGGPESVALPAKVLRLEDGEVAASAAHALGAIGVPAAEAPLIKALGRGGNVRVAAAEALGRFASVEAVLPLKEAEAAPPRDGVFRRAARTAIAQIQARVTGASPGQLSLAAGESGQLSLAAGDETGRLSLPSEGGIASKPAQPPSPVNGKRSPG